MPQPLLRPFEQPDEIRRLSLVNSDTIELVAKGRETVIQSLKLLADVEALLARRWGAP